MIQLQVQEEKLESFSLIGNQAEMELAIIAEDQNEREIAKVLEASYRIFREKFLSEKDKWIQSLLGEDYSKLVLFEAETRHGRLAFDWIQFGYKNPTGLHLHSDFVIEELFSGVLKEDVYCCEGGTRYQLSTTQLRHAPDFRFHHDTKGTPHNVEALREKTWGLCLHLGHRGVQFVPKNNIVR